MAERIVKYRLSVSAEEYVKAMDKAADATEKVADATEDVASKKDALASMSKLMLGFGAALVAGVGVAVVKAADFNEAMSNVKATGADAVENFDALREAAIDAGASTVFSATEAANAIEEMAKAGVDAADILGGGLQGALDLAAAGGLGVAQASEIAAVALKTFGLEGKDMSHVADLLAAGAGKAMGDVTDLSAALSQGGQVAAATGLSIEETTAALASFASQGLLGSDAGTSLKTMLQRLTPQSKEAKEQFEALGISAYDANGQFVGLSNFAGQLKESMKDLTPEARNAAMSVMFGSDAVRAANVLYQEGADGIEDWIDKVNDQGYAAETARTRLDNLKGDLEALGGAFDTLMIGMGDAADGPLRVLVQGVTDLIDGFNDLPGPMKDAVFWVGAVGGAALVAGGLYLAAIPKVAAFKGAMETLGMVGGRTDRMLRGVGKFLTGPWGLALAAGATSMGLLIDAAKKMQIGAVDMENAVVTAKDGISILDSAFTGISFNMGRWDAQSETEKIKNFRIELDNIAEVNENWFARFVKGGNSSYGALKSALSHVDESLSGLVKSGNLSAARTGFQQLAEQTDGSDRQMRTLLNSMPGLRDELTKLATGTGLANDEQTLLAIAMGETKVAGEQLEPEINIAAEATDMLAINAEAAAENLSLMHDALLDIANDTMETAEAIDRAQSSINSLGDAAEAEGVSLTGVNDASIRFRDSLRDVETASREAAAAIIDNGGSTEEATAQWQAGRDAIINQLEAMGLSREEAAIWADENLGAASEVKDGLVDLKAAADAVPKNIPIKPTVDTSKAKQDFSWLVKEIEETPITVWANIGGVIGLKGGGNVPVLYQGGLFDKGVKAFASGGFESGIYKGVQGGIHKFAESEMGVPWEAYISGRPADRDRNIGIWQETGARLGVSSAPQISLDGMAITGTLQIGGDGLGRIIDGRIVAADSGSQRQLRQGVR